VPTDYEPNEAQDPGDASERLESGLRSCRSLLDNYRTILTGYASNAETSVDAGAMQSQSTETDDPNFAS
jgi:hypothetical protein